jgi:hypothetical protein
MNRGREIDKRGKKNEKFKAESVMLKADKQKNNEQGTEEQRKRNRETRVEKRKA